MRGYWCIGIVPTYFPLRPTLGFFTRGIVVIEEEIYQFCHGDAQFRGQCGLFRGGGGCWKEIYKEYIITMVTCLGMDNLMLIVCKEIIFEFGQMIKIYH